MSSPEGPQNFRTGTVHSTNKCASVCDYVSLQPTTRIDIYESVVLGVARIGCCFVVVIYLIIWINILLAIVYDWFMHLGRCSS